jgi:hypothetical protein
MQDAMTAWIEVARCGTFALARYRWGVIVWCAMSLSAKGSETVRPRQLILDCYFEREGDQWLGFCLDFTLVTQAATLEEAKRKLAAQIYEYVYDAVAGDDREHASALLKRRAPFRYRVKFHLALLLQRIRHHNGRRRKAEHTPMPLIPTACH